MADEFSRFHPVVNFFWFAAVLVFSMFFLSPVYLAVSLVCSAAYALYLGGGRRLRFMLKVLLPMMILAAVINPLFSHKGATVLAYFPSGNPLTLEAVLYGCAAAVMLASTALWFICLTSVMTSDKLVYLFGRIVPSISLLISMSLRFAPRFAAHLREVRASLRGVGADFDGGIIKRAKNGVKIISIMVTWALENSIDTADSMRSRGFGTERRTAFSIYKFTARDGAALAFIFAAAGYVLAGAASGTAQSAYFPTFSVPYLTAYGISVAVVYFALCVMPIFINIRGSIKWKYIQSKI